MENSPVQMEAEITLPGSKAGVMLTCRAKVGPRPDMCKGYYVDWPWPDRLTPNRADEGASRPGPGSRE
jgi:hypothetical protein